MFKYYFNLEDISGFNSAVSIEIPHCSMAALNAA
jgi:hypothetical protein